MARSNSVTEAIDASNVARRLWVGGAPPVDRDLPEFDLLVLCAREFQPEVVAFRRRIIRCPIIDGHLTHRETLRVLGAGRRVADTLASGRTVLVTCMQGRNRSALVASLGLGLVTRMSSDELVALMRAKRMPTCLSNPEFQAILRRYIGDGRAGRVDAPTPRR